MKLSEANLTRLIFTVTHMHYSSLCPLIFEKDLSLSLMFIVILTTVPYNLSIIKKRLVYIELNVDSLPLSCCPCRRRTCPSSAPSPAPSSWRPRAWTPSCAAIGRCVTLFETNFQIFLCFHNFTCHATMFTNTGQVVFDET